MRDDNAGDGVQDPAQRVGDHRLGVHVQRGQGVVQHEDLRRGEDGPRQRKPLPLSAGQAHTLLTDRVSSPNGRS